MGRLETMAKFRVAKGDGARIARTFYDGETPTNTTGAPTVTATRANGTVLAAPAVTDDTATAPGRYYVTFTPATHTVRLDTIALAWSATVNSLAQVRADEVEVVGARYFEVADLRAMKGLENVAAYPTASLEVARTIAEEFVEDYTRAAWVPRARTEVFDAPELYGRLRHQRDWRAEPGGHVFHLEDVPCRAVIAATVDGVAQNVSGWKVSEEGVLRTDGDVLVSSAYAGQGVVLEYEYGHPAPPEDLRRATMRLARHVLLTELTAVPDRANMMTTEFATFRLETAGDDRPTGLPEVDAVLNRYRHQPPVFA